MRMKKCIKIRDGLERWLKEGPKSKQRAENEVFRRELLNDLLTQLEKEELLVARHETE